jgi:hypothetical protein
MKAGRPRRKRSKTPKVKQGAQRTSKSYKTLWRTTTDSNETSQFEPTHRLLLSALRYWEVEHDLIEERIAAMGR